MPRVDMDQKRTVKETRGSTASKKQKTAPGDDDNRATDTPPQTAKVSSSKQSPATQSTSSIAARPASTTRRPFFGVIDNVSSFSGVIEGPYDFGFAISITVDRQTFKGVVFKSKSTDAPDSVFPDDDVMMNFAAQTNQRQPASKPKVNTQQQDEVRLPDITTFHFQEGRHSSSNSSSSISSSHDSPRGPSSSSSSSSSSVTSTSAPHYDSSSSSSSTPRTPRTPHRDESPSPKDDHYPSSPSDSDHHHHHHSSPSPSSSSSSSSLSHSNFHDHLPAIHSVLQGIGSLSPSQSPFSPSSSSSSSHHSHPPSSSSANMPVVSPPPLPPQPQLQRQKQRQKKRQEKKLMELQQQQPERYQSMLERERSKIPLLGDESLVNTGIEILQHMEHK